MYATLPPSSQNSSFAQILAREGLGEAEGGGGGGKTRPPKVVWLEAQTNHPRKLLPF